MTWRILLGCGGSAVLGLAALLPVARSSRVALAGLVVAGGWPVVALFAPWAPGAAAGLPAARLSSGLGGLALTRAGAGVLALAVCAAAARSAARGARARREGVAFAVLIAPLGILAMSVRGLVPLALLLAAVPLAVAVRWGAVAGPGALRATGVRSASVCAVGLLAGVGLTSTVGLARTAPAVVGICLALGLAAATGLVPFTPWGVLGSGLPPGDADLALTWAIPVGVLGSAILVAGLPPHVAASLQALLLALGLATAVVWGAVAAMGPDDVRAPAVQAADVGLMLAGVGTGRIDGLLGALLLLVVVLLVPAALTAAAPPAARAGAWLAAAGLPPLGAFPGRLLVLAAASTVAFAPTALVTLAMGGLLVAGVRGALRSPRGAAGGDAGPGLGAPRHVLAAALLVAGPLGPVLVPLVYGVRW